MGEESIAQKPRTRRQGTVEDGRKRRRTAGVKGGLICTKKIQQTGCKKGGKIPTRENTRSTRAGGKKVKTI